MQDQLSRTLNLDCPLSKPSPIVHKQCINRCFFSRTALFQGTPKVTLGNMPLQNRAVMENLI